MLGNIYRRKAAGYLEGYVSIAVNTVLFLVKYVVGTAHNSIAIVADSVHTLSDSLTSAVVVVGFWLAYRPADSEHPLGHGRAEALATVIIATLLLVVGLEMGQRSLDKIASGESLIFSWTIVALLAVSAVVKEAMAQWSMWLGRKYRAQTLIADAWHHRADAAASALLAISISVGRDVRYLDGVLGLVLTFFILYTAINLVVGGSRELLGRGPTEEELSRIRDIAYNVSNKVTDVHHIHVHRYGNHIEVTLHVRLDGSVSLEEAHRISTEVENAIRRELGWEATVHPEPAKHITKEG